MIQDFKDKKTEEHFRGYRVPEFQRFSDQATKRLKILNNTDTLQDLQGLPSNRLEALSGNRAGQHSIRINHQWRICFCWGDNGPFDVEIVDYHH